MEISELHDDVLNHIFKFLSCEEQIGVEVICRKWKELLIATWKKRKIVKFSNLLRPAGDDTQLRDRTDRWSPLFFKMIQRCSPYAKVMDFDDFSIRHQSSGIGGFGSWNDYPTVKQLISKALVKLSELYEKGEPVPLLELHIPEYIVCLSYKDAIRIGSLTQLRKLTIQTEGSITQMLQQLSELRSLSITNNQYA